ncbi:MAG: Hsp33 family molecular chaperone HslO [Leptospirales bacterium]|nr:Hsp33 family molecular chaperone HslO [Leptospirales bacterium]
MKAETQGAKLDPSQNFFTIGLIPDLDFRFILARNSSVCREVGQRLQASPQATALLGEAMLGAFFLCTHSAKQSNTVSLHLECEGPLHRLIAFSDREGGMRATLARPDVRWTGALHTGHGPGVLRVNRWLEGARPVYSSAVEMRGQDLDRNLEEYCGRSDQIQTFLRMESEFEDAELRHVSGYMFQALPGARADQIDAALDMLAERTAGALATAALAGDDFGGRNRPLDGMKHPISILRSGAFHSYCDCSRQKVESMLLALGREEIESTLAEHPEVEVFCEFCRRRFAFSPDQARRLFESA